MDWKPGAHVVHTRFTLAFLEVLFLQPAPAAITFS